MTVRGRRTTATDAVTLQDDGAIVVVRLNRRETRNLLTPQVMETLAEIAKDLRRRADVRAVVITGGDDLFSAGIDLKSSGDPGTLNERRVRALAGPDLCRAWEEIEAVAIVAIEGYCVGGACALALACDFRVMGASAIMRLPEVPLGMHMSWGAIPRVTAIAGPARAKRFIIEGAATSAETCLGWGLTDEVAPDGQALTVAMAWAGRIAALPPIPVRMAKAAINTCAGLGSGGDLDRDPFLLTLGTADLREGVSAFVERRDPAFRGD